MALSDSIYPCEECGRTYNHVLLSECPSCRRTVGSSADSLEIESQRLAHLELIGAHAKTTHAIRAVVLILRFFMLNLFLVGLWVMFGVSDNAFLIFLNCALWLTGAIITLYRSAKEFERSE